MDYVDSAGKVRDELGAGYEEEDCNNPEHVILSELFLPNLDPRDGCTYPINEFKSHTKLNIHPTVVSPRNVRQLNTISREKCRPATSAVNRISPVATPYHMDCKINICLRIFNGGSSVSAPGRGGRRRRAILFWLVCVFPVS